MPLLLACRGLSPRAAFLVALPAGMAAAIGVYSWIMEIEAVRWYHVLLLALWLGLFPALWSSGVALLVRSRLPLLLTAPALWVVGDWVKAHAGFMAVPWATLAHGQHRNLPLLQTATLAGEYGTTFLVALGNVALADAIARRRPVRGTLLAAAILAVAHLGGWGVLAAAPETPVLRVGAVQPSILLSERATPAGREASYRRLMRLTTEVAEHRPALVAWPETAIRDLSHDPAMTARIQDLVDGMGIPLVVGASEFMKFTRRDGPELPVEFRAFNSAYVFRPGRPPDAPYRKIILVPFAEYLPLEGTVRWPSWFVPQLFHSIPGDRLQEYRLDDGTPFTVRICWEGVFADLIRPSVQAGARLLVQINNANHFNNSAAEPQHLLVTVLRAVENRTPILVSSNSGPSAIIDPYGRVLAEIPDLFAAGTIDASVRLGNGGTLLLALGRLVRRARRARRARRWLRTPSAGGSRRLFADEPGLLADPPGHPGGGRGPVGKPPRPPPAADVGPAHGRGVHAAAARGPDSGRAP